MFDIRIVLGNREVSFAMELNGHDMRERDLAAYLAANQVCDPEVVHLMMRAIREGDIVIDGGANLGYFTLLLSKLVGPTGKVIAVEPSPPNLERLRRNLALNGASNVEVIPKALWSESGKTLDFHLTEYGGYDSLIKSDRTIETIQVETIALRHIRPYMLPRLAKFDLEGAEIEALSGMLSAFFVVVEAHDESVASLRAFMEMRGHETYILHSNGALPSKVPESCKLLPQAENSNLLFILEDKIVEAWPEVLY